MLEAETAHVACLAAPALRIRVRKSAMGSFMLIEVDLRPEDALAGSSRALEGLPRGLDDAGELPLERQVAEADAAQAELAQVRAGAAAPLAARVAPDLELRGPLALHDEGRLRHVP